jgi:isopenicillin N synthase-like dioxygenase
METNTTSQDALGRLLSDGLTCLDLSPRQQEVSKSLFREFAAALPALRSNFDLRIPSDAVDAHAVTGYHPSGELPWSYSSNTSREGLVWSRRGVVRTSSELTATIQRESTGQDDPSSEHGDDDVTDDLSNFFRCAERMEDMLHEIAVSVLEWIESYLELSPGWFQRSVLGNPNDSLSQSAESIHCHHQWHLKNYVLDASPNSNALFPPPSFERDVVLPVHTDPSLVSVVILDRPGKQDGALGLQYWDRHTSQWREVESSGHGVAVVLIGSVLSRITRGHLHAPKHRVIGPAVTQESLEHRRAATMFLRPAPDALLQVPPSPLLMEAASSSMNQSRKEKLDPITFGEWTSRVSKNYRRRKAHVK